MKYLLPLCMLFYSFQSAGICTLPAPNNFKSQNIASCQFTVKWKSVNGAVSYHLQYKPVPSGNWIPLNDIGNVTSYTITGLAANITYNVKVVAVCANGEEGTFSVPLTITTGSCSTPANVSVSSITAVSAIVSWNTLCEETNFKLRYRETGTSGWTTISNVVSGYQINGLQPGKSYDVRVKAECGSESSQYSSIVTFTTTTSINTSRKNVLLVIIDDARFDSYAANGGPSFFNDTAISRVANEGVNFQLSFSALSMCTPSRASIASGLYPHIHGVTDNASIGNPDTITQITLPQILHNNGYYTGLIGKYHVSKNPQPGYDFWMEAQGNDFTDTKFNINGVSIPVPGHITDVVADSAIGFLKKVPQDQPFYLWLAYAAPHTPMTPRPEDDGIFDDAVMPTAVSPDKYTVNYPGFLYNCHSANMPQVLPDFYRSYFEMLNGVDVTLGKVFNQLETMGLMDSTLIIFMSDNGYMIGEHKMLEKQLAYEESIRVPIFMRYPGLIPAGTKVSDNLAMNIDIAPTILDFAGLPDTFGMQGVSLLKMMNNSVERKELLYEFFDKSCVPDLRAIRSLDYKYVNYSCSHVTEELFDLVNDPYETTNLVNEPAFAGVLQQYRDKLTFWRNYYQDFGTGTMSNCSLSNPERIAHDAGTPLTLLTTYPNPSNTNVTVHFISSESATATFRVINTAGTLVHEKIFNTEQTEFSETLSVENLPAGNYFAVVQHGRHTYQQSFIRQ